jgi:hypothetical protein
MSRLRGCGGDFDRMMEAASTAVRPGTFWSPSGTRFAPQDGHSVMPSVIEAEHQEQTAVIGRSLERDGWA